MKQFILKWLGLDDLDARIYKQSKALSRAEIEQIQRFTNTRAASDMLTEAVAKGIVSNECLKEAVCTVLQGSNYRAHNVEILTRIIESEKFIDDVVERIRRKQV